MMAASGKIGLRLSGVLGAIEYVRLYGRETDVDLIIEMEIQKGNLAFDPIDEKLYVIDDDDCC